MFPSRLIPNRDTHLRWLTLLEAALWLALAIQLARLLWALLAPVSGTVPAMIHALPAELPALAEHDPFFGRTPTGTNPASSGVEGWHLFGLRQDDDGGSAILARDQGNQAVYRPGDELAPGLALASVAADHVLVRDGSVTRRVDLPSPVNNAAARAPISQSQAPTTPVPTDIEAIDVDPGQLLARTGLKAYSEGGQVIGYTLMPQGNGALLRLAGLRPGDVLLRVNQQPLAPGTIAEVAEELKRDPRATIEFQRDGELRSIALGRSTP